MAAKKNTANLSVVNDPMREEWRAKRDANDETWDKAEKKLWITNREMRQRSKALRAELELYREQIEAIPFDIASGGDCPPYCLDTNTRRHVFQLVEDLNPIVEGLFHLINDFAEKHGTHKYLDFESRLDTLKDEAATTGFQIGVLAGIIFSGQPKDTVDKFERGLAFAMSSRLPVKRSGEKE